MKIVEDIQPITTTDNENILFNEALMTQILSKLSFGAFFILGLVMVHEYPLYVIPLSIQMILALFMTRSLKLWLNILFTVTTAITLGFVSILSMNMLTQIWIAGSLQLSFKDMMTFGLFIVEIMIFTDALEQFCAFFDSKQQTEQQKHLLTIEDLVAQTV
jgi:hypothetical protein